MGRSFGGSTAATVAAVIVAGLIVALAAVADNVSLTVALAGLVAAVLLAGGIDIRRRLIRLHQAQTDLRRELAASRREQRERDGAAVRRLVKSVASVEKTTSELAGSVAALSEASRRAARVRRRQVGEVEALLQLYEGFAPRAPMPPAGEWALDPTGLLEVLFAVDRLRPRTVLELGSGTSTVWIAYRLREWGGRLVSVDHDAGYAERTTALLAAHELSGVVELRHAPLHEVTLSGQDYRWYEPGSLSDLREVDLLLVDGPPGATGPHARYPALPLLHAQLSPTATVILDDVERKPEKEIVRRWLAEHDGALTLETSIAGRVAVLSYTRPPTG